MASGADFVNGIATSHARALATNLESIPVEEWAHHLNQMPIDRVAHTALTMDPSTTPAVVLATTANVWSRSDQYTNHEAMKVRFGHAMGHAAKIANDTFNSATHLLETATESTRRLYHGIVGNHQWIHHLGDFSPAQRGIGL